MPGLDWIATGLTLLCIYLLGQKSRYGWLAGIGSAVAWMAYAGLTGQAALGTLNFCILALNLRGWVRWASDEKPQRAR